MKTNGILAFDVETCVPLGVPPQKALDPWYGSSSIFSYAVCDTTGQSHVVRPADDLGKLMAEQRTFVAHNCHFEMAMLLKSGIKVPEPERWEDTMMIARFLHNLDKGTALDVLARKYASRAQYKEWNQHWEAVHEARSIYGTYDRIPEEIMKPYQVADVEATMLLYLTLAPLLQRMPSQWAAYRREIEIIYWTVKMESRGILLDQKEADTIMNKLDNDRDDCIQRGNALCGTINLQSNAQVRHLLFNKLRLPVSELTESGLPSVSKTVLEEIDQQYANNKAIHEVTDLILKQRASTKGIAIIRGYKLAAGKDNIIHPHIGTNTADTGRQSSTNPNMQNVAKELNTKSRYTVPARRCFRARPGYFLLLCDYAGIEMRLGVQGTQSKRLYSLLDQDFDFHDAAAKSFYGDRYTKCTDLKKKKMLRSSAKNARFAMFYGAGLETVARTLGISVEEANVGYLRDRADFPEFYVFMQQCTAAATKNGYIETFFGRRLYVYSDKPYSATDYKIQGSAAEVLKIAECRVMNFIKNRNIYLLLPVHDELIFEYPYDQIKNLKEFCHHAGNLMTTFDEIDVKLTVEWKFSTSTWDKARDLKNL
jgi:DNA polymerase-1